MSGSFTVFFQDLALAAVTGKTPMAAPRPSLLRSSSLFSSQTARSSGIRFYSWTRTSPSRCCRSNKVRPRKHASGDGTLPDDKRRGGEGALRNLRRPARECGRSGWEGGGLGVTASFPEKRNSRRAEETWGRLKDSERADPKHGQFFFFFKRAWRTPLWPVVSMPTV